MKGDRGPEISLFDVHAHHKGDMPSACSTMLVRVAAFVLAVAAEDDNIAAAVVTTLPATCLTIETLVSTAVDGLYRPLFRDCRSMKPMPPLFPPP